MASQSATLQNWKYDRALNRLSGDVFNHPRFDDGEAMVTSPVKSAPDDIKEGNTIVTKNTEYLLGKQA